MSKSENNEGSGIAVGSTAQSWTENRGGNWRQSKWLAIAELVVVALIFVADARHLIPFSKTPFFLAFGWLSLGLRKVSWRSIGLSRYRSWQTT